MMSNLYRIIMRPTAGDLAADIANAFLRIAFGILVFVVHGWHKAEEGARHLSSGADWGLAREIQEMGLPAPTVHAVGAAVVQLIAPLFIIAGLGTRPAAAALAAVLGGAVAQNLHAGRDPQLALLYFIVAVTLAVWGSGRLSIDAALRKTAAADSQNSRLDDRT